MTTIDEVRCDGLGCHATTAARGRRAGWMVLTINEFGAAGGVFARHADLCPVHAQALLDVCGPIPRRA